MKGDFEDKGEMEWDWLASKGDFEDEDEILRHKGEIALTNKSPPVFPFLHDSRADTNRRQSHQV